MVLLHNVLMRIESLSDEVLHDLWFMVKAIFAMFLFIGIVVVWDSLPSSTPIADLRVQPTIQDSLVSPGYNLTLDVSYRTRKYVPYVLNYRLFKDKEPVSLNQQVVVSDSVEHSSLTFTIPSKGQWCLETSVEWDMGLSIKRHTEGLNTTCFKL